jgi:hypothetical protein
MLICYKLSLLLLYYIENLSLIFWEKLLVSLVIIKSLLESLYIWLSHDPDITFAISLISQYMHAPTIQHLSTVTRILRYLKKGITSCGIVRILRYLKKSITSCGIVINNNRHTNIMGYFDYDRVRNALDLSTTG